LIITIWDTSRYATCITVPHLVLEMHQYGDYQSAVNRRLTIGW